MGSERGAFAEASQPLGKPRSKRIPETAYAVVITRPSSWEFFYNEDTKESSWEVPEEVAEKLLSLVEDGKRRIIEEEERQKEAELERKRELELEEERIREEEEARKRRKVEIEEAKSADEDMEEKELQPDKVESGSSSSEDEDVAARIRALRGEPPKEKKDSKDKGKDKKDKKAKEKPPPDPPEVVAARVAAFKELLAERNTSAFAMWEATESTLLDDKRYQELPEADRRRVFDEYCLEASQNRPKSTVSSTQTPLAIFKAFVGEHSNHRTTWSEFFRKHGRDREFLAFKDPRGRERAFDEVVAEKKERHDAEVRETKPGFMDLLKETKIADKEEWKDVKRRIDRDERYRAVRSSTDKELWFKEHMTELAKQRSKEDSEKNRQDRKAREQAALAAREAEAQKQRRELEYSQRKAVGGYRREEAERELASLLVDLVRSHDARFQDMLPRLQRDERWSRIRGAIDEQKIEMAYSDHLQSLWRKRLRAFHDVLDRLVGKGTQFDDVWPSIRHEQAVARLEKSEDEIRSLFTEYMGSQSQKNEKSFMDALAANNFLQFHVRNAVLTVEGEVHEEQEKLGAKAESTSNVKVTDDKIWEHIDIDEVHAVLRQEKAYHLVDKAERDRMILAYIRRLMGDIKQERGGTRDLLIAKLAGGNVGAKADEEGEVGGSGKPRR